MVKMQGLSLVLKGFPKLLPQVVILFLQILIVFHQGLKMFLQRQATTYLASSKKLILCRLRVLGQGLSCARFHAKEGSLSFYTKHDVFLAKIRGE